MKDKWQTGWVMDWQKQRINWWFCCWLLLQLWDSVIVLCFVGRYFVFILVLHHLYGEERADLEVIKLEFILRLKIKRNDWLLEDTCPQAANDCALF